MTDFEALECIRSRRRERQANGVDTEPPDEASGALAAEEATARYLSKMPAAQQTREKVWFSLSFLYTYVCHILVVAGALELK